MEIKVSNTDLEFIDSDLLVIGCAKEDLESEEALSYINNKLDGILTEIIEEDEFSGKYKETLLLHTLGKLSAKRLLIVGLGERKDITETRIKETAGILVKTAKSVKANNVATTLFQDYKKDFTPERMAHSFVEGLFLADYKFAGYKNKEEKENKIEIVELLVKEAEADINAGIKTGLAYATATNLTRDLVNTPSNLLYPADIANKAIEIAEEYEMDCTVIEKDEMEELGMGGLLAVAQGSVQAPKMIVLKYQGREKWDDVLGLVGKGLTFDSGGISIKPSANMDEMKSDMGGAGVVLGVMEAIGQLKPDANVLAVIPATENMPSGSAYKPGDVITTLSGKTIEVLNTDAEGRVVLADGITYAKQLGVNRLIDIATLTGAVVVALGQETTGAMTNNQDFVDQFLKSSKSAGEKVWQMPMYEEYGELVKSDIADVKNSSGRSAGSITAAKFLETFVEETPWIHLDIAGSSFINKNTLLEKKGGTGSMVRSIVEYIQG